MCICVYIQIIRIHAHMLPCTQSTQHTYMFIYAWWHDINVNVNRNCFLYCTGGGEGGNGTSRGKFPKPPIHKLWAINKDCKNICHTTVLPRTTERTLPHTFLHTTHYLTFIEPFTMPLRFQLEFCRGWPLIQWYITLTGKFNQVKCSHRVYVRIIRRVD